MHFKTDASTIWMIELQTLLITGKTLRSFGVAKFDQFNESKWIADEYGL